MAGPFFLRQIGKSDIIMKASWLILALIALVLVQPAQSKLSELVTGKEDETVTLETTSYDSAIDYKGIIERSRISKDTELICNTKNWRLKSIDNLMAHFDECLNSQPIRTKVVSEVTWKLYFDEYFLDNLGERTNAVSTKVLACGSGSVVVRQGELYLSY